MAESQVNSLQSSCTHLTHLKDYALQISTILCVSHEWDRKWAGAGTRTWAVWSPGHPSMSGSRHVISYTLFIWLMTIRLFLWWLQ